MTHRLPQAGERRVSHLPGIPRKVDEDRIRAQMRDGLLSSHEAAFWTYGESASQTGAGKNSE